MRNYPAGAAASKATKSRIRGREATSAAYRTGESSINYKAAQQPQRISHCNAPAHRRPTYVAGREVNMLSTHNSVESGICIEQRCNCHVHRATLCLPISCWSVHSRKPPIVPEGFAHIRPFSAIFEPLYHPNPCIVDHAASHMLLLRLTGRYSAAWNTYLVRHQGLLALGPKLPTLHLPVPAMKPCPGECSLQRVHGSSAVVKPQGRPRVYGARECSS